MIPLCAPAVSAQTSGSGLACMAVLLINTKQMGQHAAGTFQSRQGSAQLGQRQRHAAQPVCLGVDGLLGALCQRPRSACLKQGGQARQV